MNDDEFLDSKYSYKGEEYDDQVSMIFDYFAPISENIAKSFIADLVKNTDIDPNTIFNRWVFINLIIRDKYGWYLRTQSNIIALKTLTSKEFAEETGQVDGLFQRNPDTKELCLIIGDYEVKVGTSFIKQFLLDDKNNETKKPTYFQYFEDSKGDYYWEARIEDSLAP
ncbi:hypothetical protein [Petrimonas sp.]|uniref:hypothetical protein n=1 Tax=Petrimonas sp. TaxID=2023866 RepID=UPI002FC61F0E